METKMAPEQTCASAIQKASEGIINNCGKYPHYFCNDKFYLLNQNVIIDILEDLKKVMFPGYFEEMAIATSAVNLKHCLLSIYNRLYIQLESALTCRCDQNTNNDLLREKTESLCSEFFDRIPFIQEMLLKDVNAAYEGDPAAKSREEVIISYPGFYAIFVYRIAHEFYIRNVPFIPRIMTEHAHSKTGIDINPGATIGEYFFIDHGTGVVIGETCVIGNNVKLYQGVTLGALSTRGGQKLTGKRRHPTVEDNVTIYSGASILGGDTVIGENSVIGGNAFITESVAKNTKVTIKLPELNFKEKSFPQNNQK